MKVSIVCGTNNRVKSEMLGNRHTDTHTDTQTKYCNLRCACAPKVNECLVHQEAFLSNNAYEDISRAVGCCPDSILVKTSTDNHRWPDEEMLRQSKFLEPVPFLGDLVLRMASAFLGVGKRASITAVDLIQRKKLDSWNFMNLI